MIPDRPPRASDPRQQRPPPGDSVEDQGHCEREAHAGPHEPGPIAGGALGQRQPDLGRDRRQHHDHQVLRKEEAELIIAHGRAEVTEASPYQRAHQVQQHADDQLKVDAAGEGGSHRPYRASPRRTGNETAQGEDQGGYAAEQHYPAQEVVKAFEKFIHDASSLPGLEVAPMIPPDSACDAVGVAAPHGGRVLIVGGGIAGSSLLFALSRRGVPAVLLEKGSIGRQGASGVGAALLNPHRGRSGKPGPYDLAGLRAFWRLVDALRAGGWDPGARRSGVLRVASSARQARAWDSIPGMERQAELPFPYRAPDGAFLVPDGGWVKPAELLAALHSAVLGTGATGPVAAEVAEEREVERVERRDGSWLVHTDGEMYRAPIVVLCTGADEVPGAPLPRLERVAGDQVAVACDVALPYPIAGGVYLASAGDRVLIGGNHREPGTNDRRAPELLRASAARMVPPLADSPLMGVWTGVRAKRPDNVPISRELEPGLWFLGAFGGRGFLTAPLLASRLSAVLAERLAGSEG